MISAAFCLPTKILQKVNRPVGSPEATSAVEKAHGPGRASTLISFCTQSITISSPGSEIPGIPASVTTAILHPSKSFFN